MQQQRVLLLIPTLNERESISILIMRLEKVDRNFDILIVDDNSKDGTGEIVKKSALKSTKDIYLLERKNPKDGIAGAYYEGYLWGLDRSYSYILQMDADGQHNPGDLPKIIDSLISGEEMVIGSRYCPGGQIEGWSKYRLFISQLGNLYFRILFGSSIRDCTGGFKGFHDQVLTAMWQTRPTARGFTFHAETTLRALRSEIKICEVPITFSSREKGDSKMSLKSGIESILLMSRWRLQQKGH